MDVQVIRLSIKSALHSGRPGVGAEETDHSIGADSIFGALISQLALRDATLIEPLTRAFPRRMGDAFEPSDPPFLLTSAFPFAGDVLFFPTPMLSMSNPSEQGSSEVGVNKSLKKVRYVSSALFEQMLNGKSLTQLAQSAIQLQNGQVWLTADEQRQLPKGFQRDDKLWETERRPRVSVDRATNRSNIFFHGATFYQERCGIWFGLTLRDPAFTLGGLPLADLLRILLCDLETYGLGQLRSYGLGEVQRVGGDTLRTIRLPDPTQHGVVSLSRFAPMPDDLSRLNTSVTSYKLVQVGGRMSSGGFTAMQRHVVPMLAEGSVIGAAASGSIGGCLIDASPDYSAHPAWRYGLMFPVGIGKG